MNGPDVSTVPRRRYTDLQRPVQSVEERPIRRAIYTPYGTTLELCRVVKYLPRTWLETDGVGRYEIYRTDGVTVAVSPWNVMVRASNMSARPRRHRLESALNVAVVLMKSGLPLLARMYP